MLEDKWRPLLKAMLAMPPERLERALRAMPPPALRGFIEEWRWKAFGGQREPEACASGDPWRVWLMMAGRGFGKTRAGAEWVWARVREVPGARIALVGGNLGEVEKVMVTGPSGLIATAGTGEKAVWSPGKRMLSLPNGARAFAYSAERPEALRGPEHHFAWCDELAKWRRADETWDNLMLGLRLGERPRTLVTTTPRPVPLLKRIKALDGLAETGGRSDENLHLPADALAAWKAAYGRTRLARQELEGVLFDDAAGSLWPRAMIEASRGSPRGAMGRVVIGVDPPASAEGVCGISVCGSGGDGCLWVLADLSAGGLRPEGWASKAAAAAGAWEADRVVAEANNGGDMVESVLRNVAPGLAVKLVHASRGKVTRAEPVASLFETGKARFAGVFPELEDELAGLVSPGGYQGPGRSPDRADAMVWALTELSEPQWPEPRIRRL